MNVLACHICTLVLLLATIDGLVLSSLFCSSSSGVRPPSFNSFALRQLLTVGAFFCACYLQTNSASNQRRVKSTLQHEGGEDFR